MGFLRTGLCLTALLRHNLNTVQISHLRRESPRFQCLASVTSSNFTKFPLSPIRPLPCDCHLSQSQGYHLIMCPCGFAYSGHFTLPFPLVISGFVHVVACSIYLLPVCRWTVFCILFIHSSSDGHLSFYSLPVIKNTAMVTQVQDVCGQRHLCLK